MRCLRLCASRATVLTSVFIWLSWRRDVENYCLSRRFTSPCPRPASVRVCVPLLEDRVRAWPGIPELSLPLPGVSTGLRREGRSGEMGLREGGGALRADPRTGSAPYRVLVVPEERKGNMYVFVVSVPSGG